eukprot:jgi/Undpi1/1832/HiC_scaffold_12.g05219.m1
MTPVLFVTAASYLCVGTSKAFMLANNRIATSNINTNWRKADNCNKAMVENRFGPGHMISRSSSSSSRGFASETVARPPRVPSAMDHMESSRTSACLLRLQAIFGEVTEVGGGWSSPVAQAVEFGEVITKGERVLEQEKDLPWTKKTARMTETAAAPAAPAVPERERLVPRLVAAEGGREKCTPTTDTSAKGGLDDGSDTDHSFTVMFEQGVVHQEFRDPSHLRGRSKTADRSHDTSSTTAATTATTAATSTTIDCSGDSCAVSYSPSDSSSNTGEEGRRCSTKVLRQAACGL